MSASLRVLFIHGKERVHEVDDDHRLTRTVESGQLIALVHEAYGLAQGSLCR